MSELVKQLKQKYQAKKNYHKYKLSKHHKKIPNELVMIKRIKRAAIISLLVIILTLIICYNIYIFFMMSKNGLSYGNENHYVIDTLVNRQPPAFQVDIPKTK